MLNRFTVTQFAIREICGKKFSRAGKLDFVRSTHVPNSLSCPLHGPIPLPRPRERLPLAHTPTSASASAALAKSQVESKRGTSDMVITPSV